MSGKDNDKIRFRLFEMPCCGQLLCWVNPRLPNRCPECGDHVLLRLRTGEHTKLDDDNAWLRYGSVQSIAKVEA